MIEEFSAETWRRLQEFLDWQHSHPRGLAGWLVGERMRQQHALETDWTLAQLEIAPGDEVLELDFGAGHAIAQAASLAQSGHVIGVDLSSTMVQVAHRRNARLVESGRARPGLARVHLCGGDGAKIITHQLGMLTIDGAGL